MGPEHCNAVPGVVLPLEGEMVAMVASLPPSVNILVVDGDLTPSASPPGLHRRDHVTSHDLKQLYESSTVTKWLEKCRTIIVEVSKPKHTHTHRHTHAHTETLGFLIHAAQSWSHCHKWNCFLSAMGPLPWQPRCHSNRSSERPAAGVVPDERS